MASAAEATPTVASTTPPSEDGVERSGAHAAIAHDGGHERGTGPPSGEQPQPDREHGLDEAQRGQLQRGAALLDQHLALAASAYEQRDRSQGDDQPGQPRGEDAHGGDALVRGAQPAAAVRRPSGTARSRG